MSGCSPHKEAAAEPPGPTRGTRQKEAEARLHDNFSCQQEGGVQGPRVALSRTRSSASHRLQANDTSSTAPRVAMRRTFSMRKSSSVRERYWRIHDTADGDGGDDDFNDEDQQQRKNCSKKDKKGKFLRAWKKLFKF
ncbi:hypothetical protein BHM03_00035953 [Ensete ventricosum]|nr:hypothetical protein BHM03_00035953 [Ensete ventricosum]